MDGSRYKGPWPASSSYGTNESEVQGPYYTSQISSAQQHDGLDTSTPANISNNSYDTDARMYAPNVDSRSYFAPYCHNEDPRMLMASGSNWGNNPWFASHSNQQLALGYNATPYHQHNGQAATDTTANQPMNTSIAMLGTMSSEVNVAPWSPLGAVGGGRPNRSAWPIQIGGDQYFSDTTRSSYASSNFARGHLTRSDCGTPLSSMTHSHSPMPVGMPTRHSPYHQTPSPGQMNTSNFHCPSSFRSPSNIFHSSGPGAVPGHDAQSAARRAEPRAGIRDHHDRHPRSESYAPSQTTETSTFGTASNSTDGILECSFADCGATFSGRWKKGNLSRHKKSCHGNVTLWQCEDSTCTKTFRRSDARSKHYKKHHPELAVDARLIDQDQDVALKEISAWSK